MQIVAFHCFFFFLVHYGNKSTVTRVLRGCNHRHTQFKTTKLEPIHNLMANFLKLLHNFKIDYICENEEIVKGILNY